MINFPPFVCVADIRQFSDTRSYYGHMANSYFPGVNMKQKQNAKFAYDKRFCIDPITFQKKPIEMPGTIGIIPVCATKDINRADEVIVKYCTGSTGYIINNILQCKRTVPLVQKSNSVIERDKRASRRSSQKR